MPRFRFPAPRSTTAALGWDIRWRRRSPVRVNGTVSKVALTGSELTAGDYTQLRTTGPSRACARTRRPRIRQAPNLKRDLPFFAFYGIFTFAVVQWLYFVASRALPIGIALPSSSRTSSVVAWARLVQGEAASGLGSPGADARRPRARFRVLARLDARHRRRHCLRRCGDCARDVPPRGRARRRAPRAARRSLLRTLVRILMWAVVQPWWTFPTDADRENPLGNLDHLSAPVWAFAFFTIVLGTIARSGFRSPPCGISKRLRSESR